MTQEELDALLNSDNELENIDLSEDTSHSENIDNIENIEDNNKEDGPIMPPPADEDHKVVAQLDEVTKESEEKASEVLEIITSISDDIEKFKSAFEDILLFLEDEKLLFEKLHEKFPNIKTFEKELEKINSKIKEIQNMLENAEDVEMRVFSALEIMQYQDIHRQKIERVINIMRALIRYMNKLFEGKVSDEERVKSATYIPGDNKEVVSDEEIEELLKQFGA
jgi:predicted RNase H-like nuclease (RuvC/YqgF family)